MQHLQPYDVQSQEVINHLYFHHGLKSAGKDQQVKELQATSSDVINHGCFKPAPSQNSLCWMLSQRDNKHILYFLSSYLHPLFLSHRNVMVLSQHVVDAPGFPKIASTMSLNVAGDLVWVLLLRWLMRLLGTLLYVLQPWTHLLSWEWWSTAGWKNCINQLYLPLYAEPFADSILESIYGAGSITNTVLPEGYGTFVLRGIIDEKLRCLASVSEVPQDLNQYLWVMHLLDHSLVTMKWLKYLHTSIQIFLLYRCHNSQQAVSHVTPVTLAWHILDPYWVTLWKSLLWPSQSCI